MSASTNTNRWAQGLDRANDMYGQNIEAERVWERKRMAAPELYGALQRIVDAWTMGDIPIGLIKDAKAILAKADGR